MIASLEAYRDMKDPGVKWLGEVPERWNLERANNLFTKVKRSVREADEVVACFRDGTVTSRECRLTQGFAESLKETRHQGIRRRDLVVHAMDACAGTIGVASSDGKGTSVYAVCQPKSNADAHYHAFITQEMARRQWIPALAKAVGDAANVSRNPANAAAFVDGHKRSEIVG